MSSAKPSSLSFLQGGGAMGERIRSFDWARHPLGPPQHWPPALRMALSLCLDASFPTAIYWGPELYVLYNDAWSQIPAERHPWILGKPAREGWADIWPIVGPQLEGVLASGTGFAAYEQMLPMVRGGVPRETWWNYSFTAIRDADNRVGGVFNQGNEVTDVVLGRRERQAEIDRWRELFRQAPAAVALLRGPQHVFEFANDTYLRLTGGRAIIGRTVADALPEVAEQGFVALLDRVYATGEAYVGTDVKVTLQLAQDAAPTEYVMDFVYQPVRGPGGTIDAIFVQVTDVTARARAEAALRITNWQLGEERARLAATVEAEQRARAALRRVSETLEEQIRQRTAELSKALAEQSALADRLRATMHTSLVYQGFLDVDGVLRDANAAALALIGCTLEEVAGRLFWDTPWFTGTPGMPQQVRAAVAAAMVGETVRRPLELELPAGRRRFDFSVRPVTNAAGQVIGLVPEAVELRAG